MARIVIDIPDDQTPRFMKSMGDYFGYRAKLEDGSDNPEGRNDFVKRMIGENLMSIVKNKEYAEAIKDARQAMRSVVDVPVVVS